MTLSISMPGTPSDSDWLVEFHDGSRRALGEFYREHFQTVDRAVARVLTGPDRETVVHEVFFRVISTPELRRAFRGGSPAAWIATVARNHAIDFRRRHSREVPLDEPERIADSSEVSAESEASETEARMLMERFCRDVLPEKWKAVFQACFVEGMTQRNAAARLGISRTTLLYRQHRVRALLEKFLLGAES